MESATRVTTVCGIERVWISRGSFDCRDILITIAVFDPDMRSMSKLVHVCNSTGQFTHSSPRDRVSCAAVLVQQGKLTPVVSISHSAMQSPPSLYESPDPGAVGVTWARTGMEAASAKAATARGRERWRMLLNECELPCGRVSGESQEGNETRFAEQRGERVARSKPLAWAARRELQRGEPC